MCNVYSCRAAVHWYWSRDRHLLWWSNKTELLRCIVCPAVYYARSHLHKHSVHSKRVSCHVITNMFLSLLWWKSLYFTHISFSTIRILEGCHIWLQLHEVALQTPEEGAKSKILHPTNLFTREGSVTNWTTFSTLVIRVEECFSNAEMTPWEKYWICFLLM